MTARLEEAFAEAAKLSDSEQDALATWLLAELTAERRWQTLTDGSPDQLEALAAEAVVEHRAGRTQALDPDAL